MIKIPPISPENKKAYKKDVTEAYKKWCESNKGNTNYKELFDYVYTDSTYTVFNDVNLDKIITGDIRTLRNVASIISHIPNNDDSILVLYNNFKQRKIGKNWSKRVGVLTCPYCNRNYTTSTGMGIHPEYDHFLNKARYPYLCVSMYNLIPSCRLCNGLKGPYDTTTSPFIYPFEEEYGKSAIFDINLKGKDLTDILDPSAKLNVVIKSNDGGRLPDYIEQSKDALHIEDLYSEHSDYIKDIIKLAHIYNSHFLKDLKKDFEWLSGFSDDSIKDLVFMNKLMEEDWIKRPFSKLTSDILDTYWK